MDGSRALQIGSLQRRSASSHPSPWVLMLAAGIPLTLFSLLTWHLLFFWAVNPQYSYGWVVPGLAVYLFVRRWGSRPRPQPVPSWIWLLFSFCLIALAPIWLVREATPDWSVVSWVLALTIVVALLLLVCRTGGTPWLTHFAFPICFVLTAVPWPQRIELALVQGLMRFVAGASSEILDWIGIAAVATGNLIRFSSGSVAIDEACSGIRSLQAMLMISLFLGELRNLNVARRATLAVFAVCAALALNLARTTVLAFVFSRWGVSAFDVWHDPTGHAIFVAGLVLLSGLAFFLKSNPKHPATEIPLSDCAKVQPLSAQLSVIILLWLAAIVGVTELWYWSNERNSQRITLEVAWPESMPGYKELSVPNNVRAVLLCSSGRIATWRDGGQWLLFKFQWHPGRTATQSARMHGPDTCFQASGAVLDRQLAPIAVAIDSQNLRFKSYLFNLSGQPLYVFFTIWEEATPDTESRTLGQDWSGWSRIQRAFARQRNLGQESLEFALSGPEDYTEAVRMFKNRLPELIRCRVVQ